MAVTVCDVGPRDGLQNDAVTLQPAVRAELCSRLAAAGLPRVEAVSFVSEKWVPQMAGAEAVLAALPADDRRFASLVLNGKGLERAVAAGSHQINLAYPLTDTFAAKNQNTTTEAAATACEAMVASAHDAGATVTVTLAVAFGCPFEGRVDPGVVDAHAGRMAAAGADAIVLADTVGVGVPAQVRRLLTGARAAVDGSAARLGLHLHNTRNTGYANAYAGLEHDVSVLDASVGGIGGCPFAPRATGNIATEDLLYLLEGEGVDTGVDLDALLAVVSWLGEQLGRDLPGLLHRAGRFPA